MIRFFKKTPTAPSDLYQRNPNRTRAVFNSLIVKEVRRETEDSVSLSFVLPERLHEDYRFLPGQYLTLKNRIDGQEIRRSYSICSSPFEGELRVAVKEVDGGRFSTYANRELKAGERLEVMTPEGRFTFQPQEQREAVYVGFAAGSGITPILSILKTVLEKEPRSRFLLFYGNRKSASIIFKNALDDLKDRYLGRLEVHHVLSREDQGSDALKGRIDEVKCRLFADRFFAPLQVEAYYLCGPEDMTQQLKTVLAELSVPKERVQFELFTAAQTGDPAKILKQARQAAGRIAAVTVVLDGEETHFDMDFNRGSVLDAALDAGADVPFACKGAVCCTCRAKVLEGEVEMDMNYALEDDEVDEGYVLTCQSHPRSERVVISYDA